MESNDITGDPYKNSNNVGECEASGIIESRKRKASDDVLEDRKRKAFDNGHKSSDGEGLHLGLDTLSDTDNLYLKASNEGGNLHLEASNEGENLQLEASNEGENLHFEASNEGGNLHLEASSEGENSQLEASCERGDVHLEASNEGGNLHSETSSEGENSQLEASCERRNVEALNKEEDLQLESSSDIETQLQLGAASNGKNLHLEDLSEGETLHLGLNSSSVGEIWPCTVETITSQWGSYGAMTMCGFIWPRNSVDAAGDDISRGSKPVGIQLTSVSSGESCKFLVDDRLRSHELTWEVKAFEWKMESGRLQLFKRSSVAKKETYVDLFPNSTTLQTENSIVRNRPTDAATTHDLTITINRPTYREATIEWASDAPEVDRWLIIIRNEGRTPRQSRDPVRDSEWMILMRPSDDKPINRIDQSLVSLEYEAGHKYTVAVFGLCEEKTFDEIMRYMIVANSTTSFRAEHTKEDLEKLLIRARGIREHTSHSLNDHMRCQWLYRDKPKEYFIELEMQHDNIMTVYDKDANGDPASVIHGQLKGLFFSANVYFRSGEPMRPIFGDVRVKIPALKMLSEDWKIYFADLYCLNTTHLVTLVLAEPDSEADKFCAQKLICLSRTDKSNNPFLFVTDGTVYVSSRITVEVFYTKNIDLKLLESEYNGEGEECDWWINKRHGEKWKKKDCSTCNLYTSPLPDAFLV